MAQFPKYVPPPWVEEPRQQIVLAAPTVKSTNVIYTDGRTLDAVLADLYARVGVIVTPPPPPPTTTELINDGYDLGLDGELVVLADTKATSHPGTPGTLRHSSAHSDGSGLSLYVLGHDAESFRYVLPSRTSDLGKFYVWYGATPSQTIWFQQAYAGNGTTIAYRIGIDSTGHYVVQNGTAGSTDTSTFVAATGKVYRFSVYATASGAVRVVIHDQANINAVGDVGAADVIQITTTQAAFTDWEVGLLNALTGGGSTIPANLTDESWELVGNGVQITAANSSADNHTGGGSCKGNTSYSKDGSVSMRINGTTWDIQEYINSSHTHYRASGYLKFTSAPGTDKLIFCELRNGGNTATAIQVGVDTAGKAFGRNGNAGTGSDLVTAATAFSAATEYRFEIDATASGSLVIKLYRAATGAGVDSTDIWQTLTMTNPITAASFSREWLGQIANVTTAGDISIDRWKSSNSGMPSAAGAGTGADAEFWFERLRLDSFVMPPNANIVIDDNPPPTDHGGVNQSTLEPPDGKCWWGCTAGPVGASKGSSSRAGLDVWEAFALRRPDIVHMYHTNAWNGQHTPDELAMLEPSGKTRAMAFHAWKPNTTMTMADQAAGGADSRLQSFCAGIKQYSHKIFLTLQHEFDNDSHGAGNSFADYVAFWRHAVQFIRAQGVTNVVFVWDLVGYSGMSGTSGSNFAAMYPGDDVVDWIGWDPYFETATSRPDFRMLVNEDVAGGGTWTGMYDWAVANHPTKPIMLCEWSPNFLGAGMTDASAATKINSIPTYIPLYPRVKAMVQWNSWNSASFDARIQNHTTATSAFATVGALARFQVGTVNAP